MSLTGDSQPGERRKAHPWRVAALGALAAGLAAFAFVAIAAINPHGSGANSSTVAQSITNQTCPKGAAPLPPGGLASAVDVALAEAPSIYGTRIAEGGRATRAERFPFVSGRAQYIKDKCGRNAARRTVVVTLFFPAAKPSASLSQGTVFVSKFQTGYRVWTVAH